MSSDLHQELAVRVQKNLELEKTAEKTDIDGEKDEKIKSILKKILRLIRLEHHFIKFRMAVLQIGIIRKA